MTFETSLRITAMPATLVETLVIMLFGAALVVVLGGCTSGSKPTSAPQNPSPAASPVPPEVEFDPATAAEKYRKAKQRP
jgi:hypothetical protein